MGNVILYDLGHEIWLEVYIKLNICVRASVDTPSDLNLSFIVVHS